MAKALPSGDFTPRIAMYMPHNIPYVHIPHTPPMHTHTYTCTRRHKYHVPHTPTTNTTHLLCTHTHTIHTAQTCLPYAQTSHTTHTPHTAHTHTIHHTHTPYTQTTHTTHAIHIHTPTVYTHILYTPLTLHTHRPHIPHTETSHTSQIIGKECPGGISSHKDAGKRRAVSRKGQTQAVGICSLSESFIYIYFKFY